MMQRFMKFEDRDKKYEECVWLQQHKQYNIGDKLQQLYRSTLQLNRSMYGIKIYEQPKQKNKTKQHQPQTQLKKIKVDQQIKQYLSWCYFLLNWESISADNMGKYINSLPEKQNQVQDIRIQGVQLKFYKFNKCLTYDLCDGNSKVQDVRYFMDSYDSTGQNALLEYQCSLCKITLKGVGYRFDGLIRIVESCDGFAAVATAKSIYIINLKTNTGNSQKFEFADCLDMKWSPRGLYFLQKKYIGLIQRQVSHIATYNSFSFHSLYDLSTYIKNEYKPQRIGILNRNKSQYNLALLASSKNNTKKYMLQIIDSSQLLQGNRLHQFVISEVNQQIVYKNLVEVNKELTLVVVSGEKQQIGNLHMYRFGIA